MSEERKNVYVPASLHKDAKRYALEHDETLGEFVAKAIRNAMRPVSDTKKERPEDGETRHEAERKET